DSLLKAKEAAWKLNTRKGLIAMSPLGSVGSFGFVGYTLSPRSSHALKDLSPIFRPPFYAYFWPPR
ncbi:hypothetical protein Csa_009346, partial [Cucumis sativus]